MTAGKPYHRLSFEEKREQYERKLRPHKFRCDHCGVQLTTADCAAHVGRCPRKGERR